VDDHQGRLRRGIRPDRPDEELDDSDVRHPRLVHGGILTDLVSAVFEAVRLRTVVQNLLETGGASGGGGPRWPILRT
jgi:hypothetical protein